MNATIAANAQKPGKEAQGQRFKVVGCIIRQPAVDVFIFDTQNPTKNPMGQRYEAPPSEAGGIANNLKTGIGMERIPEGWKPISEGIMKPEL